MNYRKLSVFLLIFVPLALYGPFVANEFVTFDDHFLVRDNPQVQQFDPSIFWSYDPELYVPFTLLSYQIDHVLLGGSATAVHLVSLLLHILTSYLVYVLLRRLKLDDWSSLLGALIFAVHPLQVESVAWASGRKEVLFSMFFLLSLLFYVEHKKYKSITVYVAALLSKVTALTLPATLLLFDWHAAERICWKDVSTKWIYWLLSIVFAVIALFGKSGDVVLSFWETLLLACRTTVFFLSKFFVPTGLTILHPVTETIRLSKPEYFLPVLVLVSLMVVAIYLRKKQPQLLVGYLFFLVTLAPSLLGYSKAGQIQLASEHYAYLPMVGLLIMLMSSLRTKVIYPILTAWLLCLILVSYQRLGDWRNSEALYLRGLEVYPTSHVIANNLASVYLQEDRVDEAIRYLAQTIEWKPTYAKAYANLSEALRRKGRFTEAQQATLKALELDPKVFDEVPNAIVEVSNPDAEIATLQQQIEVDPNNSDLWWQLGNVYGQKEMYLQGIQAFQKAASLDPARQQQAEELRRILERLQ